MHIHLADALEVDENELLKQAGATPKACLNLVSFILLHCTSVLSYILSMICTYIVALGRGVGCGGSW